MTFSITYTPEEFLKLVGDTTTRSFLRMLPVFSALSLFSGVMFGLLSGIGVGVGAFLLILAVLFLLNVMLPRSRAKRSLETMQQSAMTIRLTLTERGLVGSSARPGEETRIAWVSLQHAVDKEDCVEFYNNRVFIRVPKRCIPDMNELRRIVDAHMPQKTD